MNSIEGIVLKKVDYKDNDRIITLLTKERGRVDLSVRGARKVKSPLMAASEIFTLGEYVIVKGKNHETLSNFTLIESFYDLRFDYELLSIASVMLLSAYAVASKDEPAALLFLLLKRSLLRLNSRKNSPHACLASFLLHFSNIEGFKPRLNHCAVCERRLEEEENAYLCPAEGGLVCSKCAAALHFPNRMSAPQITWLRQILLYGLDKVGEIKNPPDEQLKQYVSFQIERRLPKT